MEAFAYDQLPTRIVFGAGAVSHALAHETQRLGSAAMLIAGTSAQATADGVAGQLEGALSLRWDEIGQHVAVELAGRARAAAAAAGVDVVIAIGGGSAIGLAKAIALTSGVPIVAVPTTYAGSEQTPIWGLTGGRHKQTGRDPAVLPRVVIYDPELTRSLPPHVTGPSAFNALAHCVEALYAPEHNPITTTLALEAAAAISRSLPTVLAAPDDVDARGDLLYGAALAGMALGATSPGLHHKICHVLGGMFGLVHADTHSVVLPHAVAFNAPALPETMEGLARTLGAGYDDTGGALWDLATRSALPTSLSQLHGTHGPLQLADLPPVAAQVAAEMTANPRPLGPDDVLDILHAAHRGTRPHRPERRDPTATST